jgi:two-component sensor histidine kinase
VLHNAFRHAFSSDEDGTVELRATRLAGGAVRLMVSDDGQGLPKGLDWPNRRSTGGRIVMDMLEGLDASLFVSRGAAGTTVTIDIPVDLDAA